MRKPILVHEIKFYRVTRNDHEEEIEVAITPEQASSDPYDVLEVRECINSKYSLSM